MRNKITRRLSLRVKFKNPNLVELVVMDDKNNIQVEIIPINLPSDGEEDFVKAEGKTSENESKEINSDDSTFEENGIPQPEIDKEDK